METAASTTFTSSTFFVVIAILLAVAAGLAVTSVFSRMNTVPSGLRREGFQGPGEADAGGGFTT